MFTTGISALTMETPKVVRHSRSNDMREPWEGTGNGTPILHARRPHAQPRGPEDEPRGGSARGGGRRRGGRRRIGREDGAEGGDRELQVERDVAEALGALVRDLHAREEDQREQLAREKDSAA